MLSQDRIVPSGLLIVLDETESKVLLRNVSTAGEDKMESEVRSILISK